VAELKSFARDGGYRTASLWLAEGYDLVRAQGIEAPMHARFDGGELHIFGLGGDAPVSHVSYYEADAIARYLGARLPTEAEWEIAAAEVRSEARGRFVEDGALRPLPADAHEKGPVRQLFGDAWEWTRSSYEPYPGYEPPRGALGEYNGKFMVNQRVLRGGSCLTPRRHMRATYRNFWPAATRFQMAGLRLAKGAS
jgi:ergothioneine biosynthesis protein EgtB